MFSVTAMSRMKVEKKEKKGMKVEKCCAKVEMKSRFCGAWPCPTRPNSSISSLGMYFLLLWTKFINSFIAFYLLYWNSVFFLIINTWFSSSDWDFLEGRNRLIPFQIPNVWHNTWHTKNICKCLLNEWSESNWKQRTQSGSEGRGILCVLKQTRARQLMLLEQGTSRKSVLPEHRRDVIKTTALVLKIRRTVLSVSLEGSKKGWV